MTVIEAAKTLGCSPQFVRDLIKRKRIKAQKVGRDWNVSKHSLETYIANRPR